MEENSCHFHFWRPLFLTFWLSSFASCLVKRAKEQQTSGTTRSEMKRQSWQTKWKKNEAQKSACLAARANKVSGRCKSAKLLASRHIGQSVSQFVSFFLSSPSRDDRHEDEDENANSALLVAHAAPNWQLALVLSYRLSVSQMRAKEHSFSFCLLIPVPKCCREMRENRGGRRAAQLEWLCEKKQDWLPPSRPSASSTSFLFAKLVPPSLQLFLL